MDAETTVTLAPDAGGLEAAAELLRAGRLVAFPTETVYGLGANAASDRAVARIFAAKGRPAFNPLIIHLPDLEAAERLAELSPEARRLAERFWPGPLTLVLPRRADAPLSMLATAGLQSVALRVPDHPLASALLEAVGSPLAAPSANRSGRVSATTAAHVRDGLDGRIAAVLDGGACPVGVESTIVGFHRQTAVLLRPGGLPVEMIEAEIGRPLDQSATRALTVVTAPGQLSSHYAPDALLRLEAEGPRADEIWIGFGPVQSLLPGVNLSPAGDLEEAAANLFAAIRRADALAAETGASGIAVAPIPETGLGLAINDRLRRAAAPRD